MSGAELRIMTRVIKRRVDAGEDIDDVFEDYPKLTEEDKETIRAAIYPDEPQGGDGE